MVTSGASGLPGIYSILGDLTPRELLLTVGSGILLTLSFPPINLAFLAWVSLLPLFLALERKSPRKMLVLGWMTGFVHSVSLFYWTTVAMNQYGKIPLVASIFLLLLLSLYLGCYIGFFGWLLGLLRNRDTSPVAAPALWVVLEYLRSHLFTGLPWGLLGHSQYQNLLIIQISDITGVSGVSFSIVLVNVFLFLTLKWALYRLGKDDSVTRRFPLVYGVLTVVVVLTVTGYGWVRLKDIRYRIEHSPTFRVALIQGNIDQSQKWNPASFRKTLSTYQALSEQAAARESVDLIVWPETAVPGYYVPDLVNSDVVRSVANRLGTPIIFGSLSYDQQGTLYRTFNSAFLVSPGERETFRYDKIHLVPFGEYVPLKPLLPFVDKLVEGIGEFSAGKEHPLFSTPKALGGVLICYEVIFPRYACAYARKGVDVLVNITNDAWFGKTGATYQHLCVAAFRAVETRLPLIRAANTGVSALVSPTGEIVSQSPIFIETFLTGSIPIFRESTFFVHYRRMFDFFCAVIVGFFALRTHLFRKGVDILL